MCQRRKDRRARNARRRTQGSYSERERVSWLRSRVTTRSEPPRRASRPARFPSCGGGGGKTRLVSLSLITILYVVVDDEGHRRASGPVYRQHKRERPMYVCIRARHVCACLRCIVSCVHERTRTPRSLGPLFLVFFPRLPILSSLSPVLPLPIPSSRSLSLFLFAPLPLPECWGACSRGATLATLARSVRCQLVATHLPSRLSRHRRV